MYVCMYKQFELNTELDAILENIETESEAETRLSLLNLNLQRVFKNHQYFMVSKSNFGAFFQETFFLCGISLNHLRFTL